tara:strand:- start:46 stop:234 length:189 start_codon:yes stop_codon:yes gene_type:complete
MVVVVALLLVEVLQEVVEVLVDQVDLEELILLVLAPEQVLPQALLLQIRQLELLIEVVVEVL